MDGREAVGRAPSEPRDEHEAGRVRKPRPARPPRLLSTGLGAASSSQGERSRGPLPPTKKKQKRKVAADGDKQEEKR